MLFVSLIGDFNKQEIKAEHTKEKITTIFFSEEGFEKIRVIIFFFVCEAFSIPSF